MTSDTAPRIRTDDELFRLIEEGFRLEPWYTDRWFIAAVAGIAGAVFVYTTRMPKLALPRPTNVVRPAGPPATLKGLSLPAAEEPPKVAPSEPSEAEGMALLDKTPVDTPVAGTEVRSPVPSNFSQVGRPSPLNGALNAIPVAPDVSGLATPLGGALPPAVGSMTTPIAAQAVPQQNAASAAPAEEAMPGLYIAGTCQASARGALAALASKFGGGIKDYQEVLGRTHTANGYLVWVSDRSGRSFLNKLATLSGIDVTSTDTLSVIDRSHRISEAGRTALVGLQKRRADLVVRYFEDAPVVKDVDDEISAVQQSIDTMKAPGAGMAIAKFEISN